MQGDLFGKPPGNLPEGFRYQAGIVPRKLQEALLEALPELPFKPFDFHGYEGKRRVVSFGWKYDFDTETVRRTDAIPRCFCRSGNWRPTLPDCRRRDSSRHWSPNTMSGPRSVGTGTRLCSAMSSGFRCSRPAHSGCAESEPADGSGPRSFSSRARDISSPAPRDPNGSIPSRP